MLRTAEGAVRWANADDLAVYEGQSSAGDGGLVRLGVGRAFEPEIEVVGREAGFEEAVFLGLRMNVGVDLEDLREEYGDSLVGGCEAALAEVVEAGLMERDGSRIRLTARGRMASNEVFSRLLVEAAV
jgi:oxygen-independent coproporphyrinogen-3 oxidase